MARDDVITAACPCAAEQRSDPRELRGSFNFANIDFIALHSSLEHKIPDIAQSDNDLRIYDIAPSINLSRAHPFLTCHHVAGSHQPVHLP